MTTEDEAKDTRCCGPEGCGIYREVEPGEQSGIGVLTRRWCIASDCMAWRYSDPDWNDVPAGNRGDAEGYCGLAGKP